MGLRLVEAPENLLFVDVNGYKENNIFQIKVRRSAAIFFRECAPGVVFVKILQINL